ncbi:4-hydroxythreonine-4-phosphate dehydrogenase PdxA [Larsenimonas salina]|uniref:4-hydroxythreonine-4-phosphate dehydrogenase PdxA n=1 Tax=Larsenimonas salina TaxID=1295565 RepID=UPI0020747B83|nr:4-hydroxythreonine-4-phosphate dehydrogenase PdxA [Larsenimonas salina]MCM5703908.1 4-hydroxythreonine-4-phosphate dehydrogenase PdxA [Larsenimonas salina]
MKAELAPLVITPGEPAGIGPDLIVDLACDPAVAAKGARWVAVGDPRLFEARAVALGRTLEVELVTPDTVPAPIPGVLFVWPVALERPVTPGQVHTDNARFVLETLDVAITACREGRACAMVTAPLHKGVIIDSGETGFTGHTEYLRDACGVSDVVMMLATEALRVALVTTHLPLRAVSDAITDEAVTATLEIVAADLTRYFGIESPRIGVCGLNPHAGEGGHLGHEDGTIIAPALERLRARGMKLTGPLPADTAFTPRYLDVHDAMVAMYHDQGLPVLKYAGFGRAANITLGLPIIRTSVDHGTALDLAGTGAAERGSLDVAIEQALTMARSATTSSTHSL